MDKLDMFQEMFGKVDEFGWWYMKRIQTDAGTQFTYKGIQEGLYVNCTWGTNCISVTTTSGNEW